MSTILCIDDEPAVGVGLEHALAEIGHRPVLATSVDEGMQALGRESFDLIISDYRMPNATGIDLLDRLRQQGHDIPVIIMTGYASVEHAVLSMRHGAVDYLTKPLRAEALRLAVNNAIEVRRLRRENEEFRREIDSLRGARRIVGKSRALLEAMDLIAAVAPTRATILLEGESGTGKELFARAIHEQSPRAAGPLVTVNCAALPEGLVESALFGHERGAFTGATSRAAGAFERAHQSTLLLDEISEMRLDLQSKLLRAIQEQEFERVGGNQMLKVDVRVIATTNRDLKTEVDAGRFRSDLYYRLNVVPIHTPPLRERLDDIPHLVEYFTRCAAERLGVKPPAVPEATIDRLQRRLWPGNVRELANAIERAVILGRTGRLDPELFPGEPGAAGAERRAGPGFVPAMEPAPVAPHAERASILPIAEPDPDTFDLRELERRTIERALAATRGHRTRAAEMLGISERTLRYKLNGGSAAAA